MEIRKAFSEGDLEISIWYNVWRGLGTLPNVFPYEGKINEFHRFMNTEDTNFRAPIESFRGRLEFRKDGLIELSQEDYDCYMPGDKGYEDKWGIIKRK